MSGLGSSIIGGLFQMGGQLISNAGNARQNRLNRNAQATENNKQREWERAEWFDRTNYERAYNESYNSPTAQMQRLKDAGINPHLAYSNGAPMNTSNVSLGAGSPGSGIAALPPGRPPQFDGNAVLSAMETMARIENIKSDTRGKDANTASTQVITGINALDLENKVNLINQENEQRALNIKATEAGINLTNENVKKVTQEIINLATTNDKLKQEVDNLVATKKYTEAQTVQMWALVANAKAMQQQIISQTNLNNEKAKTEVATRSYLGNMAQKVGEEFKALMRGNQVGDRFDISNAEANYKANDAAAKRAVELLKGTELGNKMQQLQISEQEMINFMRAFDVAERPLESIDKIKNAINPFKSSSSTTTLFDDEGNYKGHKSTRTRTKR